jgi:uncharacterized membrane protein (DUF4010 family)
MGELDILFRIVLAGAFGALLGLETETRESEGITAKEKEEYEKQRIGGVRTFVVFSLFGAVAGLFYIQNVEILSYLMFTAATVIILAAYVLNVIQKQAFGLTTEFSILIVILLGFAATSNLIPYQILLVFIALLAFVISQKSGISDVVERIEHAEVEDVAKFAIVALVIFPFLPNNDILVGDVPFLVDLLRGLRIGVDVNTIILFNPFNLWRLVVLISGLNLIAYFLYRSLGKSSGLLLAGFLGGLISSTSTTVAFATESLESESKNLSRKLAGNALIANASSFINLSIIAFSIGIEFFLAILPAVVMFSLTSFFIGLGIFNYGKGSLKRFSVKYNPYSIGPAIKFVVLFTVISFVLQLFNKFVGGDSALIFTALSGAVGIDIPTIALGENFSSGLLSVSDIAIAFIGTNYVNFAAKALYSYIQGSREYASWLSVGLLASAVTVAIYIVLLI